MLPLIDLLNLPSPSSPVPPLLFLSQTPLHSPFDMSLWPGPYPSDPAQLAFTPWPLLMLLPLRHCYVCQQLLYNLLLRTCML